MGNATGQGADGFHFLSLLDLGFTFSFFCFRILSFGYIPQNAPEPDGISIRISHEGGRELQGDACAVFSNSIIVCNPNGLTRFLDLRIDLIHLLDRGRGAKFAGIFIRHFVTGIT